MQSQDQSKDPGQFRRIQAKKQESASSKPQAWQVKNANQPNFQAAGRWDKGVPILNLKPDLAIQNKIPKQEDLAEDPKLREHLIQEGDSLYGITARYFPSLIGNYEHFNAKMQEIADLNGLGGITGTLLPGQKLKIPMKIQPSPNLNAHEYAQHHVQAGEGFWVITEKYFPDLLRTQGIEAFKAKMQEIAEFNGLLYYYSNIDPSKFSGKPLLIPLKTKPVEPIIEDMVITPEEESKQRKAKESEFEKKFWKGYQEWVSTRMPDFSLDKDINKEYKGLEVKRQYFGKHQIFRTTFSKTEYNDHNILDDQPVKTELNQRFIPSPNYPGFYKDEANQGTFAYPILKYYHRGDRYLTGKKGTVLFREDYIIITGISEQEASTYDLKSEHWPKGTGGNTFYYYQFLNSSKIITNDPNSNNPFIQDPTDF